MNLDTYFKNKKRVDSTYWAERGLVSPPSMYYGSEEGVLRIFPGRHYPTCNIQPQNSSWYVAATSVPKNIVLVLDVSNSMASPKLDLLKEAAGHVIETLRSDDKVAIVSFSSTAHLLGDIDGSLLSASTNNKAFLVQSIRNLTINSGSDYFTAFQQAFNSLNQTVAAEKHVPCNSAILFFTDGESNESTNATEKQVTDLITSKIRSLTQRITKPVTLFTYSINSVSTFPKRLACSIKSGFWSKIDGSRSMQQSFTSYHRFFAYGLDFNQTANFVSWVEPYNFTTGSIFGTTASFPVFDRSLSPPKLLGVVGIDLPLVTAYKEIDMNPEADFRNSVIERISLKSKGSCPALKVLKLCDLELLRHTSGSESTCTSYNCSANVSSADFKCLEQEYSQNLLWSNILFKGLSYIVRDFMMVSMWSVFHYFQHAKSHFALVFSFHSRNECAAYLVRTSPQISVLSFAHGMKKCLTGSLKILSSLAPSAWLVEFFFSQWEYSFFATLLNAASTFHASVPPTSVQSGANMKALKMISHNYLPRIQNGLEPQLQKHNRHHFKSINIE